MYDMLAMLKPGEAFSPDDMAAVVSEVCASGDGRFENDNGCYVIRAGNAFIRIEHNAEHHVVEESEEIAEDYGFDCAQCTERYEISGEDFDMVLFNDHLLMMEKLCGTGKLVIFDTQQCEEFKV